MELHQHTTIASMHRIGIAFHPHMVWHDDVLADYNGERGAHIEDGILTVFHNNGNRSHFQGNEVGTDVHCVGPTSWPGSEGCEP